MSWSQAGSPWARECHRSKAVGSELGSAERISLTRVQSNETNKSPADSCLLGDSSSYIRTELWPERFRWIEPHGPTLGTTFSGGPIANRCDGSFGNV